MRRLALTACLLLTVGVLLAACAGGPRIDRSHEAVSQGSRVQYVILHFTWDDWDASLATLTKGPVSSHYLVRDDPVRVYQLVEETRRAFHAGESSWAGNTNLNSASIGIEIVNSGDRLARQGQPWQDYPPAQIDAVVALVADVVKRHGIRPEHVLGHSDVAPLRKLDPGPKFPWQRLAAAGLIRWPDPVRVAERRAVFEAGLPDVTWFQAKLAAHGYGIAQSGVLDADTRRIIAAFQMKYRPARFDGQPDAETAALLDVLTTPAE